MLLTHRSGILPLSPETRRIALIGPLAAAPREMLGPWASAGRGESAVSILEGLKAALPQCRIDHAPGVDIAGEDADSISAAVDLCADAEVVVLCLGEAAAMSGEAASRADLGLPGRQRALAEACLISASQSRCCFLQVVRSPCPGSSSGRTPFSRPGFSGAKRDTLHSRRIDRKIQSGWEDCR